MRARRTVTVKMPPGVADGMRVRLSGHGEVGPGGGPAGDLYVEVEELAHDVFTRDGVDLHCTVRLPMTAAALGATLPLPTLDGVEELHVEAGTQAGTIRTLRGKGMPRLRSTGRVEGYGDLLVHVDVVVPGKLDPRQTELLRELARLRGEEQPDLAVSGRNGGGLFSRLRDTLGGGSRPAAGAHVSTPPLFLIESVPAVGESVLLGGAEGRHAADVRRIAVGETVLLGDGRGCVAHAEVTEAGRGRLELRLQQRQQVPEPRAAGGPGAGTGEGRPRGSWPSSWPPRPAWTPSLPWRAARSVARWDDGPRGAHALQRWRSTATQAAKQCRRAWVPEVHAPVATPAPGRPGAPCRRRAADGRAGRHRAARGRAAG